MDIIESKIPFPQADDMSKVKRILNIDKEERLKDKVSLSQMLGDVAPRQVQYYLSACMYLGIISQSKEFTDFGRKLRTLSTTSQNIELIKVLIRDEVFGTIYVTEKTYQTKLDRDDVIEIMKRKVSFNSEEMYKRRSQTVIKWIEWINDEFGEKICE